MKESECLNDVRIFDPVIFEWKYIKVTGEWIDIRRNHSSVIVGKYMLIHGGINNKSKHLNDF